MTDVSTKESLRREFLERRLRMPFEDVYRLSAGIQKRFVSTPEFRMAKKLSLYASFRNEALTDDIFYNALKDGKEVYFPRVVEDGPHLEFYMVKDIGELSMGSYEILEPPKDALPLQPASLDCIVVPGVAFDRKGARIGYGKGYYDRVLNRAKGAVIALSFDFQVITGELPLDEHDVGVDCIVTETRVIKV